MSGVDDARDGDWGEMGRCTASEIVKEADVTSVLFSLAPVGSEGRL